MLAAAGKPRTGRTKMLDSVPAAGHDDGEYLSV